MSKIIITNNSSLKDHRAVKLVMKVIQGGRISNFRKQYCHLTIISNWEGPGKSYQIASFLNKGSDRFVVNDHEG